MLELTINSEKELVKKKVLQTLQEGVRNLFKKKQKEEEEVPGENE